MRLCLRILPFVLLLPCGPALAGPPHAGTIIYFNRCDGGCTFQSGTTNNSITDVSTILSGTATFTGFSHGDQAWAEVVQCVQEKFAPFDVVVTDIDPGPALHSEVVVAGSPEEGGFPSGTAVAAPFSCSFIEGSPSFAFANLFGSTEPICEAAAASAAYMFGLDSHYYCEDLMSYLSGCGPKSFVDQPMQCGEFEPRTCQCGEKTQNSFAMLLAAFGPKPPMIFTDRFEWLGAGR